VFLAYISKHGIKHQTTALYTPHQNGVAKRTARTLVEMAIYMLHSRGIKKDFGEK